MADSEVTLEQVRDILEMLRRTIEGAAELARRIDVLEKASGQSFDIVVTLQQNQEKLLTGFESYAQAQNKLNSDLTQTVSQLLTRLDLLEGRQQVM